jgi:hypothetical protein
MPFNVLLLPLLGGYVFMTKWNRTRFNTKRYSGERLLFHAAVAGVLLLVIAFVVVRAIDAGLPTFATWWRHTIPFPYAGTSLGAFLVGSLLWFPLNYFFFPLDRESKRAINEWNDFLEILLEKAMRETKQISVTMKHGKVYIGFVTSNFDPAYDRKYIAVLPMASGYREPSTHKMCINTYYAAVYQAIISEKNEFLIKGVEDFQITLPIAEIASVNLFDPEAYEQFQQRSE